MINSNKIINTTIILYILFLFSLYFLSNISLDLGDVGLGSFSNALLLTKAHQHNETFYSVINIFDEGFKRSYLQNTFNYPLSAALKHFFNMLFGVAAETPIYICLIFALGAIIISFYLGSLFYNRLFGIIFASLIAMDVYFNINIKTGAIIFAINVFIILGALYFFIKAHIKEGTHRSLYIVISGFFISLCLFNGYPQPYVVLLFLGVFFLSIIFIKILIALKKISPKYQNFKVLNFRSYLLFSVFAFILCLIFSLGWDYYNDVPYFTTYKETVKENIGRYSPGASPFKMDINEFKLRVSKFLDSIFIDMDRDAYFSAGGIHSDTAFPGQPILPYISGVFFFLGIYIIFKKRRESDLLLLLFGASTVFIIIFIFKPFAPRVYIFSTPFLLLISTLGYVETFTLIFNRLFKTNYQLGSFIIISLVFLLNLFNYHKIANEFEINHAGQKIWSAGQTQMYNYLKKERVDEGSLVVFAGTKDVYAWLNFIYIQGRVISTIFYIDENLNQKDFNLWEKDKFNKFDTIYFVFPSEYYVIENPGNTFGNYGMKRSFKPFLDAHPNIQPDKIIYAKSNIPLHYIYKIDKNSQHQKDTVVYKVNKDEPIDLGVNGRSIIETLYVTGPVRSIIFNNGDYEQKISLNLTKNMDCYIDFEGVSIFEFYPDFDGDDPFENVIVNSCIQKGKGGYRVEVNPDHRKGKLIYKFKLPFKIIRTDVRTSPRIFNDYSKQNKVKCSYSIDNVNYRRLYKIVSNGNVRYGRYHLPGRGGDRNFHPEWSGTEEHASYNIIYPNSNEVYFKFVLDNVPDTNTQLLSHNKNMFFRLYVDTSNIVSPIINDNSKIKIESDSSQEVILYLTFKSEE